jgi:hypothetical protein
MSASPLIRVLGTPWPIVCIDMVAGASSAAVIAPDFGAFYDWIGVESDAA